MSTIGSHPGAINFRLSVMVILILLFIYVFLHYAEKAEQAIELQSIQQAQRIINSGLVIVFATYASQGRLVELADLEGANPFEFLKEYQVLPVTYQGEIEVAGSSMPESGWYYLSGSGDLMYAPFQLSEPVYFRVVLDYDDIDRSGSFEPGQDQFKALRLVKNKQPR